MSRISNADSLSSDTKYPIIWNRDHILTTELLVWAPHNRVKHLDERQTLRRNLVLLLVIKGKSFAK